MRFARGSVSEIFGRVLLYHMRFYVVTLQFKLGAAEASQRCFLWTTDNEKGIKKIT